MQNNHNEHGVYKYFQKVSLGLLARSCVAHEDCNNSHDEKVNIEELRIREIGVSLETEGGFKK